MANNGYDQTYEDDKKENEETRALVKKAVDFVTPEFVKTAIKGAKSKYDYLNPPKETKEPVKKAKGGMVRSSASKRADGCATKGKTRGKIV